MRLPTLRAVRLVALFLLPSCSQAASAGSLIGLQYETWFTPRNAGSFETAEGIPILGKYSSFDQKVLRKHAEWFEDLGIDWLLLDWSNMLWAEPAWEQHTGSTRELEDATELL